MGIILEESVTKRPLVFDVGNATGFVMDAKYSGIHEMVRSVIRKSVKTSID